MNRMKAMEQQSIVDYIKPEWLLCLGSVAAALANVGAKVKIADLLGKLIDASLDGFRRELLSVMLLLFTTVVVSAISLFIMKSLSNLIAANVVCTLRGALAKHMMFLDYLALYKESPGNLLSIIANDLRIVQTFFKEQFSEFVYQPVIFTVTFIYLLHVNWKLLLLSVVVMPVCLLLVNRCGKPIRNYSGRRQKAMGETVSVFQDIMQGLEIVKSYNLLELMLDRYKDSVRNVQKESIAIEKKMRKLNSLQLILSNAPFFCCIFYGAYLTLIGEITGGQMIAFIQLLNYLVRPIADVPMLAAGYQNLRAATERVFTVFRMEREQFDAPSSEIQLHGMPVEFRGVSFSFNGKTDVLNELDIQFQSGRIAALTGPSGAGKSTIFYLICGLYKPNLSKGQILLFENNIYDWNLQDLRDQIAVVTQDCYLLPSSIYDNISAGHKNATWEEVVAAAKNANCHDFIMSLPKGYDTWVGEKGTKLSGGQRQRIAIARAVLKKAPILLFDEPTSALDFQAEMAFVEMIERLKQDHTIVLISHRPSTIMKADDIYYIEDGKVVESGTHESLLRLGDRYKKLFHCAVGEKL